MISPPACDGKQALRAFQLSYAVDFRIFKSKLPPRILDDCEILATDVTCSTPSNELPVIVVYKYNINAQFNKFFYFLIVGLDFQTATFDLLRTPIKLSARNGHLSGLIYGGFVYVRKTQMPGHLTCFKFDEYWRFKEFSQIDGEAFYSFSKRGTYFACSRLWCIELPRRHLSLSGLHSIEYMELSESK